MQKKIQQRPVTDWLPTSVKEAKLRGWETLDVILFSGDAYVDHPSFGTAVIGRMLEKEGYRVAIVPQPNWQDDLRDFRKFGAPRLFFGVSSGCMDSMVNHYTANKRKRSDDAYSPGGRAGFRPDYATTVYSDILKKLYPDIPVVIGGIEASLRRLTHYDYWLDKLKSSILIDSKADILVYGMGEQTIVDIARFLEKGIPVENLKTIHQTAVLINANNEIPKVKKWNDIELYSHEVCLNDKKKFAANFKSIEQESNSLNAKRIIQKTQGQSIIVNPPNPLLSEKQIDAIYDLPFTRLPHPRYNKKGTIPAYEMIRHSVTIHRGCFGGCSFCTISAHQGKFITSRSHKSVLNEIEAIKQMPDFRGYITDIGGPSANMYKMSGKDLEICKKCKKPSCIFPSICKNLDTNHNFLNNLYAAVRKTDDIQKVSIGSGIRYDLLFDENEEISGDKFEYIRDLIKYHVSGRLKVAPEHTETRVLEMMRKPSFRLFKKLKRIFERENKKASLNQQLIPYFISSHPGCSAIDMAMLAIETKQLNFRLEQVQDFTPTPMTLATVIYYSGYHPYTLKNVYTPKSKNDKLKQRQFFFWYKKEYYKQIKEELQKLKKPELIKRMFGS